MSPQKGKQVANKGKQLKQQVQYITTQNAAERETANNNTTGQ